MTNTDYDNLIALEQRIKFGCMKVELNSSTYKIDTMAASLSMAENSSSPENASFFTSSTHVVLLSLNIFVALLILVLFAIKFGYFAILTFITMLFNLPLFLIILCLMPSFEFGLSGFVCLAIGIALVYTYSYMLASNVKKEYEIGRSFSASLENAMKTHLPTVLFGNVPVFFALLILLSFSFGEITSAAIVLAVSVGISLLTNLLLIPLFINIVFSLNQKSIHKLFMLKKRTLASAQDKEVE